MIQQSIRRSSMLTLEARVRAPTSRWEGAIPRTKGKILVVDDEPDIRELIQITLAAFGYKSESAADADEALEMIHRNHLALITLDLAMPRRDGHWLLRELAADPQTSTIPIVVISAYAGRLERTSQVKAVLWKPFDVDDLGRAVEEALRRSDEERRARREPV
jgi:CheY-like chemotaxis protein